MLTYGSIPEGYVGEVGLAVAVAGRVRRARRLRGAECELVRGATERAVGAAPPPESARAASATATRRAGLLLHLPAEVEESGMR